MPVTTEEAAFRPDVGLRMHTLAVSDAMRCLTACIRNQVIAQQAFDAATQTLAREQELAICSASDADVEAFAAWLPEGRQAAHLAGIRLEQAGQFAANARAALRLARGALIAHERLAHRRVAHERAIRRRRGPISPQSGGSTPARPDC